LEHHEKNGADISIATIPVSARDATEYGIMKTNSSGFIDAFVEKPNAEILPQWTSEVGDEMKKEGRLYLASMGIYIFNRKLLRDLLTEKKDATDFGKEIIPQAVGIFKLLSYKYDLYWNDIVNIRSFYEANISLTDEVPLFNLFDNQRYIYTHPRNLPPAKISGTTIVASIIAEGCIIHAARIERSVIGIRSRIGKGAIIKNSYIMGNDNFQTIQSIAEMVGKKIPIMGIGDRCLIDNTIIDKNCFIGNDVIIKGGSHLPDADTDILTVKDGIVVIKKGAVIPDGFTL
ncbi:MAG: glucose-1-phosphate adenylyltransferase, partial [Chitinophagales bacterium]|nr:glucose-1-phosphate adenylyltransferase [Chitinophagales bacterium]